MKRIHLLFFAIIVLLGTSCKVRQQTGINYLENIKDTSGVISTRVPEPIIQKNDILSIRVYSMSIDPRTDQPYNMPETGGTNAAATGFLVDGSGNIQYPRLGTIKAEGLTKEQLAESIRKGLEDQLKQPSVIVRFTNFKVTVLGDVNNPGPISMPAERVNILEAMGMAGDITNYGKKTNVKVIREQNGQRQIGTIDLTSADLFNSPYFHLQQNDIVIVEQSGRRRTMEDRQNTAQQIGLVTSIITTIALILNFIK